MIDMIGVGPFITIPLIVTAMGGPQAMLGWVLARCSPSATDWFGGIRRGHAGFRRVVPILERIYGPQKLDGWSRFSLSGNVI